MVGKKSVWYARKKENGEAAFDTWALEADVYFKMAVKKSSGLLKHLGYFSYQ